MCVDAAKGGGGGFIGGYVPRHLMLDATARNVGRRRGDDDAGEVLGR